MATPQPQPPTSPLGPDTLVTVKILVDNTNRRFKLALRDLGAHVLPQKLRFLLAIPAELHLSFDRFSDSAGAYVPLDSTNPAVYKQLYRAAKAKLKLRLRATVTDPSRGDQARPDRSPAPRPSTYLETVLSPMPAGAGHIAEPTPQVSATVSGPVPDDLLGAAASAESTTSADPPAEPSPPTRPSVRDFAHATFSIDCNQCNRSIPNEHYHCSTCEGGDYDLCQSCVDQGITCHQDDHWLIKRVIKDGHIANSSTQIIPSKATPTDHSVADSVHDDEVDRTCNACISQLPASSFLTCIDCSDFDLCHACFRENEHGHHPAHTFTPVDREPECVATATQVLMRPGRGVKHDAICDGCDGHIVGIRHKCLSCPDFDLCDKCALHAPGLHPGHRFASLYERLNPSPAVRAKEVHRGILCDGPVCTRRQRKTWIRGDRFKCTVCPDTDFCADCEASPQLVHNATHPLLKIRTPLRLVSVSTLDQAPDGRPPVALGDQPATQHASTETVGPTSANAATQVQTVADVSPAAVAVPTPRQPIPPPGTELQAWFESESTPDGTSFAPERLVSQSWTLSNPGPRAWPAGCALYFVGGDDMRNLDMNHPSSTSTMVAANRSNVLAEPLAPDQTAVFTVLLKSPARPGRAISYWRLKTPDGLPFGHKLWVDIRVARPERVDAPAPTETAPAPDRSTMIFPKLEKESPASSTHDVTQAPRGVAGADPVTVPAAGPDAPDLVDDLESLELDDDDDAAAAAVTSEGFVTDDEYDILDASDEDFLADAERAVEQPPPPPQ